MAICRALLYYRPCLLFWQSPSMQAVWRAIHKLSAGFTRPHSTGSATYNQAACCALIVSPLKAIPLRTPVPKSLALHRSHKTAFPAQFQMRMLLALLAVFVCFSALFRRIQPTMSSAEAKPRHAIHVRSRLMTAHAWLSPAKRYRMAFRQESHSIAPALILAFNRYLLALKRITFTLRHCEVPPYPQRW